MSGRRRRGPPLVLAIDIGTSAIKVALVDRQLRIVARATRRQVLLSDATGRREHRVADTMRLTMAAVRGVLRSAPGEVMAVAVGGPRGSFAVADAAGPVRTAMISWQDVRAAPLAAAAAAASDPAYRRIAGTRYEPSVVLPKLAWLRHTQPAVLAGDWRIATPQALVLADLGVAGLVSDLTVAAHVGLLDVRRGAWSATLRRTFGIPAAALPTLVEPGAIAGHVTPLAAARWGLPAGLPLVAAASDGVCAELGAGVVEPRQLYAYLGTASTIAGPIEAPPAEIDPSLILMPGADRAVWRLLGLARAGGSAADWWRSILGMRAFDRLERLVEASPAGAGGAIFVPALAGATAPVPDSRARGAFVGLSLGSTRADMSRAVFEGVAIELRWLLTAMHRPVAPAEVRLTGGGSTSDAWSRIMADAIGLPIARVADPDPGLRGAGAYAWAAIDGSGSARDIARDHGPAVDRFEPRPEHRAVYEDLADRYAAVRRAFGSAGLDARLAPGVDGARS